MNWLNPIPRCRVPASLEPITRIGKEEPADTPAIGAEQIRRIWQLTEQLYRSGAHPAIQLCIRHNGRRVMHRAIGHASGNGPGDAPASPKVPITLNTPINIFSASKAVSAMVMHKLDEENILRIDDRVCDYIPEFSQSGKDKITIRHVLAHRAGVPSLPAEAVDAEVLADPAAVMDLLCKAKLTSQPGRALAYHAVTGGYILGEVVARATGSDFRKLLRQKISRPLGLRGLSCGVTPAKVDSVAQNAMTGYPLLPPFKQLLQRALGASMKDVVELSNDPRFLTAIIPSANICASADEVSQFYQCMLRSGEWNGEQIFAPKTVRHATAEQSFWEFDLTLGLPVRYSLGFMLGNKRFGLLGGDNPQAFGHIGLSNIFTWADPERGISVALLTTGKAIVSPHIVPLLGLINEINRTFSREYAEIPSKAFRPPSA